MSFTILPAASIPLATLSLTTVAIPDRTLVACLIELTVTGFSTIALDASATDGNVLIGAPTLTGALMVFAIVFNVGTTAALLYAPTLATVGIMPAIKGAAAIRTLLARLLEASVIPAVVLFAASFKALPTDRIFGLTNF